MRTASTQSRATPLVHAIDFNAVHGDFEHAVNKRQQQQNRIDGIHSHIPPSRHLDRATLDERVSD